MLKQQQGGVWDYDQLVLVDPDDRTLGYETKQECHRGDGMLHRAFSVFIFNDRGELLLQRRSAKKPLWPLFWSNSCCSHPRKGETYEVAARRRLTEELGLQAALNYLFSFQYHARYGEEGSENELCAVFVRKANGPVSVDPDEIADWRFVGIEALNEEMTRHRDRFTPWFKMEWERILEEYWKVIESL